MAMAIAWSPAHAEGERHPIDIEAADLGTAIAQLSRLMGISVGTDGALPQIRSRAVKGSMNAGAALEALLRGTGYRARQVGPTAWRIEQVKPRAAPSVRTGPAHVEIAPTSGEPIVVTATKRAASLFGLPMAVSAIDLGKGSPVRESASSHTADVAAEMDGMTITASGGGRSRLFLRGVADSPFNGESQSTVAVILDNARLTYSAPDPDIALVDMERAEVLKGPQGALYGTGALGGIYHLVTRKPDLENSRFSLSGGGEAVAGGGTGYDLAAVANLPLQPGTAGIRMVGYSRLQPGWIDTGDRKDSNSSQLLGARIGLGIDAGNGWRIDLGGFGQWLESRDSQYVYQPGGRSRPAQNAEPHDNDLRHVSFRLTREGDGPAITLSSAMTWHEVNDTYDATQGAESFALPDPQTLEIGRAYRVWDNEARLSGTGGNLRWLVGLSALEARQHDVWTLSAGAASPAGSLTIDDDLRTTSDLSAFGDLTWSLGAGFAVDAGARLFHSAVTETRIIGGNTQTRDVGRTGLTPAFALSWRPDATHLAYIRYGSAIRQGGLDMSPTGDVTQLKGDELETLEAGWRMQLARGGHLELGAYFTRWQDVQSEMLQANGLIETENAGDAEIKGAEASLELPMGRHWTLSAGGSLVDARLVRNDLGIELEDHRLPVVPEYTLRGALEYGFHLGSAAGSLRFGLHYVGPARFSFDPLVDRPIGDYIESKLQGRLDLGRFDLTLDASNLFSSRADQFAFGNPLKFATQRQYSAQAPFKLALGLHSSF